jgi:hypothetical protein
MTELTPTRRDVLQGIGTGAATVGGLSVMTNTAAAADGDVNQINILKHGPSWSNLAAPVEVLNRDVDVAADAIERFFNNHLNEIADDAPFEVTVNVRTLSHVDTPLGSDAAIDEQTLRDVVPDAYQEYGTYNLLVIVAKGHRLGYSRATYDETNGYGASGGIGFANFAQELLGLGPTVPLEWRRNIILHETFHGFMRPDEVEAHALGDPNRNSNGPSGPSVMATGYSHALGQPDSKQLPDEGCSGGWSRSYFRVPVSLVTECTTEAILNYTLGESNCNPPDWWPSWLPFLEDCGRSAEAWDFEY